MYTNTFYQAVGRCGSGIGRKMITILTLMPDRGPRNENVQCEFSLKVWKCFLFLFSNSMTISMDQQISSRLHIIKAQHVFVLLLTATLYCAYLQTRLSALKIKRHRVTVLHCENLAAALLSGATGFFQVWVVLQFICTIYIHSSYLELEKAKYDSRRFGWVSKGLMMQGIYECWIWNNLEVTQHPELDPLVCHMTVGKHNRWG